ncbi:MAG TPA: hypothetical protein VGH81_13300 [Rudaea sp.]|jgi:hypothetical protein
MAIARWKYEDAATELAVAGSEIGKARDVTAASRSKLSELSTTLTAQKTGH